MVASRRRPCAPGGATQMLVIINDVDRGQERGSPSRQTRTSHLARHEFRLVSDAVPDAEAFEQYCMESDRELRCILSILQFAICY